MKKTIFYISFLIILFTTNSCIEEFNAATTEFEDAIVIEASITDQLTFQKVLLSRTFKIDETQNQQEKVSGATVRVVSDGTTYTFSETSSGTYTSDIQFRAELDTDYQLLITTQDGRGYESKVTRLRSDTSNIENIYTVSETNEDGVEGISIYLDSYDPSGNSRYYSYDFQETYQIIAPYWIQDEGYPEFPNLTPQNLRIRLRSRNGEARDCYKTVNNSNGRLTTNTNLLDEDRVSRFLIAFIPDDDIKVSSRYSINVKQYVNTEQAYNFYEKVNELSSVGSLFSPVQPGFIAGNIISVNNPDEKVIGFFEVTSIKEQRMFFNRLDVTNKVYNNWAVDCTPVTPAEIPDPGFAEMFIQGDVLLFAYEIGTDLITGIEYAAPLLVVYTPCGDCRFWGDNIKPDFWID